MTHALSLLIGYLLGSIPFGLLLTRYAGTEDIRSIGSGNIGATNVLRTGNKGLAAATLACDLLKGTLAVLLAGALWGSEGARSAGLAAVLGHVFPVWLGFKGGKGVATYLGVLVGIVWPAALVFAAVWGAVAGLTRLSSLAALVAAAATPAAIWFLLDRQAEALLFLFLTAVLWFTHRDNLARLIAGTEHRIGAKGAGKGGGRKPGR